MHQSVARLDESQRHINQRVKFPTPLCSSSSTWVVCVLCNLGCCEGSGAYKNMKKKKKMLQRTCQLERRHVDSH